MYNTKTIILHDKDFIKYSKTNCILAKEFKNCCIFICRQLISSKFKKYKNLSSNEQEVIDNFKLLKLDVSKFWIPTYENLDSYFKLTKNVDYYNNLPMQSTQQLIKETLETFKGYLTELHDFNINPSKYNGRPNMPGYIKTMTSVTITNQDAVWYIDGLKLPKIRKRLNLGNLNVGKIKEVIIKPFYDTFKICIATEGEDRPKNSTNEILKTSKIDSLKVKKLNKKRILGIDLGINNFLTTSNNCGLSPLIINGKDIKAYNQYFNKLKASYQSINATKKIQLLCKKRYNYLNDKYEQISAYITNYAYTNNIGTIIIGNNNNWKQDINLGKVNNQAFTCIAHAKFVEKLKYKCSKLGIDVIEVEESYTSKASFLDKDELPIYNKNDKHTFSGTRIKRGLYKSKKGILINADVNGASNIIRKYNDKAFKKDVSYLYKTVEKINI